MSKKQKQVEEQQVPDTAVTPDPLAIIDKRIVAIQQQHQEALQMVQYYTRQELACQGALQVLQEMRAELVGRENGSGMNEGT